MYIFLRRPILDLKQGDASHTSQTPNQEDRTIKRNREESSYTAETTIGTKFKLRYNKKPTINPAGKEKETIEVLDEENPEKDTVTTTVFENEQQPATSNTQMIQKQQIMEAYSSQQARDKDMDIK